jgi:hypothetical protein
MRRVALFAALVASSLTAPAAAREFRHYFGMQWVVTPQADISRTVTVRAGEVVVEAPMLTTDLFETTAEIRVGNRLILGAGAQLATAVSAVPIRCTVARGVQNSLSQTRRICLTDQDRDGRFDHFFDVGLGQGGYDVQFTGCIPPDAQAISPVDMTAVDVATLRDPMMFRVTLNRISGRRVRGANRTVTAFENPAYEFGGSIGRNDRIWNHYRFCAGNACLVGIDTLMNVQEEGVALRVVQQDGERAVVQIVRNLRQRSYWNMARGSRPDPMYCPGTLFVETDVRDF